MAQVNRIWRVASFTVIQLWNAIHFVFRLLKDALSRLVSWLWLSVHFVVGTLRSAAEFIVVRVWQVICFVLNVLGRIVGFITKTKTRKRITTVIGIFVTVVGFLDAVINVRPVVQQIIIPLGVTLNLIQPSETPTSTQTPPLTHTPTPTATPAPEVNLAYNFVLDTSAIMNEHVVWRDGQTKTRYEIALEAIESVIRLPRFDDVKDTWRDIRVASAENENECVSVNKDTLFQGKQQVSNDEFMSILRGITPSGVNAYLDSIAAANQDFVNSPIASRSEVKIVFILFGSFDPSPCVNQTKELIDAALAALGTKDVSIGICAIGVGISDKDFQKFLEATENNVNDFACRKNVTKVEEANKLTGIVQEVVRERVEIAVTAVVATQTSVAATVFVKASATSHAATAAAPTSIVPATDQSIIPSDRPQDTLTTVAQVSSLTSAVATDVRPITATSLPQPSITFTRLPSDTPVSTDTPIPVPTSIPTNTLTRSLTPVIPTTSVPATSTTLPTNSPTATSTRVPSTQTSTPTRTATLVTPPTATNTRTSTATPSATFTRVPSTQTSTPTRTATLVTPPSATNTRTSTVTPSATFTPVTPTNTRRPPTPSPSSNTPMPPPTPVPPPPPTSTPLQMCTVTPKPGVTVNLRSGPGTNYPDRGNLSSGIVNGKTQASDGLWWRLTTSEWVRGDLVQTSGDCGVIPDVPTPPAPVPPTLPPSPTSANTSCPVNAGGFVQTYNPSLQGVVFTGSGQRANIRADAGEQHCIVGQRTNGDGISIQGSKQGWYFIGDGWIVESSVRVGGNPATLVVVQTAVASFTPVTPTPPIPPTLTPVPGQPTTQPCPRPVSAEVQAGQSVQRSNATDQWNQQGGASVLVNLPCAGYYSISVRYSNDNNDLLGGESVHVSPGGSFGAANTGFGLPDGEGWNVFAQGTAPPVYLDVGQQTIYITADGNDGQGVEVDVVYMCLFDVPNNRCY